MDEFRRPGSPRRDARQMVKGAQPAKTNTADKSAQPYRYAQIAAADVRPARLRARPAAPKRPVQRLRRGPISMELPEGSSSNRHYMTPRIRRRVRQLRTWVLRGALATTALVVGVGCLLVSQGYFNINKVFRGTAAPVAALQQNVNPNLLKGEGDGRINVLLLGIGGPGHDGSDLTDTIMLASIDPVNHKAALLSVPRDLWVTLPNQGSMKINAVYPLAKYAYMHKNKVNANDGKAINAGLTAIDQTLESVIGVPINYNMLVNFQAFKQGVDTVGGVTVNVPEDLYDPTMAWENNHDSYLARAGVQEFNGQQALLYVRSRETSSDFARSERQRSVMLALKTKAISLGVLANPAKLSGLLKTFGDNVYTDLSISDASRLYSIFKRIANTNIQSLSLSGTTSITSGAAGTDSLVTTGNINGQSIVMPKAGLGDYSAIQEYVRSHLPDGYLLKEHAKILVLNGTQQNGLAADTAATLKDYGYNVVGTAQAPAGWYPSTVVIDHTHGKKKYTKHYLEQRFSTTAVAKLPDTTIQTQGADFVVLLGSDETGTN